jgi:hypothetical protein
VQRLLFVRQVDFQIDMGGLQALVAQPQGNDRNIDPRLEQVQGGRMPEDMRRDLLGAEARADRSGLVDRPLEEVRDAIP